MQKTLSLIIAAVILYTIVQMKMQAPPDSNTKKPESTTTASNSSTTNTNDTPEPTNAPLTGNFLEKTISKVIINALKTEEGRLFFENLIQPMNKPINDGQYTIEVNKDMIQPMFQITTFGSGTIGPATCGHVVTIQYQLLDMNNNLLNQDTKTYTLGAKPIMPGMDSVIVGMMAGQTRQATIPAKYAYYNEEYRNKNKDPSASYKLNIVLQSILPQHFIKKDEVKIFDDQIAYRIPLMCGDKVTFDAKVTNLSNGKVLYNSIEKGKKLDMKIGDISYPLIFSYALYGKVPIGTRTVIAKNGAFRAIGGEINKIIPKNLVGSTDEYWLLELTDFKTE